MDKYWGTIDRSRKGVRGNNVVSKTLNKPLPGSLNQKVPKGKKAFWFIVLFVVILGFSVSQLGIKTGLVFSIGFFAFIMVALFTSKLNTNSSQNK